MTYMQSNKSLKTTANIRRKDITMQKYNIDNGKEGKDDDEEEKIMMKNYKKKNWTINQLCMSKDKGEEEKEEKDDSIHHL